MLFPHPWLVLSMLLAHEIHVCILSHCLGMHQQGDVTLLAEGQDTVEKMLSCYFRDFLLAKVLLVWSKGRYGEWPRRLSRVVMVVEGGGWSLPGSM